jgi:hypothetical protein
MLCIRCHTALLDEHSTCAYCGKKPKTARYYSFIIVAMMAMAGLSIVLYQWITAPNGKEQTDIPTDTAVYENGFDETNAEHTEHPEDNRLAEFPLLMTAARGVSEYIRSSHNEHALISRNGYLFNQVTEEYVSVEGGYWLLYVYESDMQPERESDTETDVLTVYVCVEDRLRYICVNVNDMSIVTKTRAELQYIMNRYYWENGEVLQTLSDGLNLAEAHVIYSAHDERYQIIIYSDNGVFFSLNLCIMEYDGNGWDVIAEFAYNDILNADNEYAFRQEINSVQPAFNMSLLPSFSISDAQRNLTSSRDTVMDFISEMSITGYLFISGVSRHDGSYFAYVAYADGGRELYIFAPTNPLLTQVRYSVELHVQTVIEIERLLGVNFGYLMIQ